MSYRRLANELSEDSSLTIHVLLPIFCFKISKPLILSVFLQIEEKRLTQRLAVSDAPLIRVNQ